MADIKITELPQATSVSDSDELIIQQPSGTKRAGIADLPVGSPLSAGYGIDITNDIVTNTKPMNYEETGSVPSATPLNADQLQGHPASYFQKLLTAGSGINISNDVISSKLNMNLLWTNSSPSTSFAGQNLSGFTNNSQYSLFVILFRYNINQNDYGLAFGTLNNVDVGSIVKQTIAYRRFAIYDTSITFTNAESIATYGVANQTNNDAMIPIQIYGIK